MTYQLITAQTLYGRYAWEEEIMTKDMGLKTCEV